MTIEETIRWAEGLSKEHQGRADDYAELWAGGEKEPKKKREEEIAGKWQQLAEWLKELKALKCSEKPNSWIPCSERLPEYMKDMWDNGVIATVEGREGNIAYKHGIVPDAWFEDGEWYINGVKLETARVVAWMPLPEPWEGGEE